MASQPEKVQHQLRSSCDACTTTKVKCSQDRPSCARCIRHNIPCVYGISRKATRNGATSRKNKLLSRTKPTQETPATSAPSTTPRVTDQPPVSDVMNDFESMVDAFQFPLGSSTSFTPQYPAFNSGQAATTPPPSGSSVQRSSPLAPDNASNGGNMPFGLFTLNTPSLSVPDFMDVQCMETRASNPTNLNVACASQPGETGSAGSSPDNCCSESVDIMVILQFKAIQGMKTNGTGEQGREATTPGGAVSLPFDHILATCDSACKRLLELMQCKCAAKGHMAVMHSAIISAILYWFGCAANSQGQRRPTTSEIADSPNHSEGVNSRSLQQGFRSACSSSAPKVTEAPAMLGLYQLEEEDQVAIRQTLLLSKIRRVSKAIDRLAKVGASAGNGPRNHSIHRVLAAWLRSELLQVSNNLQAGPEPVEVSDW